MDMTESLRIVVYKEDNIFIAQCVNYDICAQAETVDELQSNMECLIELEMNDSNQELDPAPERFHNMWEENQRLSTISTNSNEYRMIAA